MTHKISKRFADLVIVWKSNSFVTAKRRLTGAYVVILTIILLWFSSLLFRHVEKKLTSLPHISETQAQEIIQEMFPWKEIIDIDFENGEYSFSLSNGNEPKVDAFTQTIVEKNWSWFQYSLLHDFEEILTIVTFVILIFAGVLSYFLAWKTLTPIKANMEKQKKFVADAAHELRNPLSTIQLVSESMMRENLVPDTKEAFQDIFSESQRLIKITENLLLLDKKSMQENQVLIDLQETIQYVSKVLLPLANQKNLYIKLELKNCRVKGRQKDFEHIIYNLLHNAIKFSQTWWTISITLKQNGTLTMEDQWIGISEKHLPHIFDRFYKADQGRSFSEESGAGLGLAVVKELLNTYGADINITSTEEVWTKVSITFIPSTTTH